MFRDKSFHRLDFDNNRLFYENICEELTDLSATIEYRNWTLRRRGNASILKLGQQGIFIYLFKETEAQSIINRIEAADNCIRKLSVLILILHGYGFLLTGMVKTVLIRLFRLVLFKQQIKWVSRKTGNCG